jgi:hypothetical protein
VPASAREPFRPTGSSWSSARDAAVVVLAAVAAAAVAEQGPDVSC